MLRNGAERVNNTFEFNQSFILYSDSIHSLAYIHDNTC